MRRRLIRNQFCIVFVGLDQPNVAVPEVRQQLRILFGIQFARPKNFGGIDFCAVVDPFAVKLVISARRILRR